MKKFLRTLTIAAGLIIAPSVAIAAWTVIDPQAIARLGEQINQMKKNFAEFQKMVQNGKDQISALGEAGSVLVPFINISKLESQLRRSIECTLISKDDLKRIFPQVLDDEWQIGSVCQGKDIYGRILFATDEEIQAAKDKNGIAALSSDVRIRRTVLVVDSSKKAMALSDVTLDETNQYQDAINELLNEGDKAQSQRDQLAVIIKGQALQAQGVNTTNKLLAMLLKQKTASDVRGLPLNAVSIGDDANP